jgi:hypothetical protein
MTIETVVRTLRHDTVHAVRPNEPHHLTARWLIRRSALWVGVLTVGVVSACALYGAVTQHEAVALDSLKPVASIDAR